MSKTLRRSLFIIRNSIFSGTEQFFPGTQAFASPPDMASSGVWENIILSKTPTFDGVCGMFFLYNIILDNCQKVIFVKFFVDKW